LSAALAKVRPHLTVRLGVQIKIFFQIENLEAKKQGTLA